MYVVRPVSLSPSVFCSTWSNLYPCIKQFSLPSKISIPVSMSCTVPNEDLYSVHLHQAVCCSWFGLHPNIQQVNPVRPVYCIQKSRVPSENLYFCIQHCVLCLVRPVSLYPAVSCTWFKLYLCIQQYSLSSEICIPVSVFRISWSLYCYIQQYYVPDAICILVFSRALYLVRTKYTVCI